jgi:hypothetical protein
MSSTIGSEPNVNSKRSRFLREVGIDFRPLTSGSPLSPWITTVEIWSRRQVHRAIGACRTDGMVATCFPMYVSSSVGKNIDHAKLDQSQLSSMKTTCQRHRFSTLKL